MGSSPKPPKPAPPTAAETQDAALGRGLNLLNLEQSGYKAIYDEGSQSYTFEQIPLTPEQEQQQTRNQELEDMAYNRLKGVADPETQKLVGETFDAQREQGNTELSRYLNEQMASRGLGMNDTPALRELGLQKAHMETGLRGAESAALLDVGQRNQIFGQALREFQNNLQQQAFINRASIGQNATGSGLSMLNARFGLAGQGRVGGGMSTAGGALTGAMSGAMAGSSMGPWGALVGAGVGALGGGLSANAQRR